ncbi:MAG: hypothetical protein N2689_02930 [Verrucomicrobiae bacterium]|nr:hypothetical protein [Verrucomicrobiae bacterium]
MRVTMVMATLPAHFIYPREIGFAQELPNAISGKDAPDRVEAAGWRASVTLRGPRPFPRLFGWIAFSERDSTSGG